MLFKGTDQGNRKNYDRKKVEISTRASDPVLNTYLRHNFDSLFILQYQLVIAWI